MSKMPTIVKVGGYVRRQGGSKRAFRRGPMVRVFTQRRSRGRWYLAGYDEGADAAQATLDEPGGRAEMQEALAEDRLGEIAGEIREHQIQMAGDISYDVDRPGGPTSAQMDRWDEGFYAGFEAQVRMMLRRKK